jgi:hypothetical protein
VGKHLKSRTKTLGQADEDDFAASLTEVISAP